MASKLTIGLLALGGLAAAGAQAQEISGGELRLGFGGFLNSDTAVPDRDADARYTLEGSMELEFGRAAMQFDLSLDQFGLVDENARSGTLHGMYKPAGNLAAGAFIGFENSDIRDVTFYGVEGLFEGSSYGVEAYLLRSDVDEIDLSGTVGGIAVGYDALADLRSGAKIVYGEFDRDESIALYALTAEYRLGPATAISAELGRFDNDAPGSNDIEGNYVGVMATFSFGPGQSTTFDRRGIVDLLPGF